MCITSAVIDNFTNRIPWQFHPIGKTFPPLPEPINPTRFFQEELIITREEFEALKKEVQELKKLIEAAKEFDKNTGQKDCHDPVKVEKLRKIAELVGVDISDLDLSSLEKKL